MQSNECFMCGGNDFTVTDGAFVCNECGIQSQSIREEQINFVENINVRTNDDALADVDHEITAGSKIESVKKLLSWECFNLILLGLTKEMIDFGAKPSLKVIILQLWVRYLQCTNAAFTSKKFKKLPKLNTSLNYIDGEILYGVENLKKKLLHLKTGIRLRERGKIVKYRTKKSKSLSSCISSGSSNMTASQKRKRISRRLHILDQSTKDLNYDSTGLSDDISLLQRSKKFSKVKINLPKNIKNTLKSMPPITEGLTIEESSKLFKSGQKCWNKLKRKEKKNFLSIKKIISIIRLGLMINKDDIYLSDIIRWIEEGHFHINRVNLFLPEGTVHGIQLAHMATNSSRTVLNQELTMILGHLKAEKLPNIDFKKLVSRFCDELQLPYDFKQFVCKLILLCPPSTNCVNVLPDMEVKVMASILFTAKFLFSLDGITENLSSDFAEKVNRSNKVNVKLFNWNDYVHYIESRNSVVSQFNLILHKKLYGNKIRHSQLFINDWNIMKSTIPNKNKNKISKSFKENAVCLLKSLPDSGRKGSYREIPASNKPLSSTLKWILEYHSMQLTVETKRILEQNFIQTDILYLNDEKRINELANKCNFPINVNNNVPLHYAKQKQRDLATSREHKSSDKIKVQFVKQLNSKIKDNEASNIKINVESNTIFSSPGTNYWSIHIHKDFLNKKDRTIVNSTLQRLLPYPFFWFMRQLCMVINCHLSALYLEFLSTEEDYFRLVETN